MKKRIIAISCLLLIIIFYLTTNMLKINAYENNKSKYTKILENNIDSFTNVMNMLDTVYHGDDTIRLILTEESVKAVNKKEIYDLIQNDIELQEDLTILKDNNIHIISFYTLKAGPEFQCIVLKNGHEDRIEYSSEKVKYGVLNGKIFDYWYFVDTEYPIYKENKVMRAIYDFIMQK